MHPTAHAYLGAVIEAYRRHEVVVRMRRGNDGFGLAIDGLLRELLFDASNTLKLLGVEHIDSPCPEEVEQLAACLHQEVCRRLLPDIPPEVFRDILEAVEYAPRRRCPWDEQNQREEWIQELVRRVLDTKAQDYLDLCSLTDEERRRRIFRAEDTDLQRQARRESHRREMVSEPVGTRDGTKSVDNKDLLQRLLRACDQVDRFYVRLHHIESIPVAEIATFMRVSKFQVYRHLARAMGECRAAANRVGIHGAD
jgi:hypothetical protein